jgi:hypothetical protein
MRIPTLPALVLAVASIIPSVAKADAITSNVYNMTGTATLDGNSNCTSCSETLNFNFDVTINVDATYGYYVSSFVDPGGTMDSSGTLGASFQLPSGSGYFSQYIELFDSSGDEIDIVPFGGAVGPVPSFAANLYGCQTSTCVEDFGDYPLLNPPELGIYKELISDPTISYVPEPSSFALLVMVGLLAIGCALLRKARSICAAV